MKENVIIGKIIPAGTGMARYRNMEPKEVGVASENVYSISDIEAQMAAEDAMKNINKLKAVRSMSLRLFICYKQLIVSKPKLKRGQREVSVQLDTPKFTAVAID